MRDRFKWLGPDLQHSGICMRVAASGHKALLRQQFGSPFAQPNAVCLRKHVCAAAEASASAGALHVPVLLQEVLSFFHDVRLQVGLLGNLVHQSMHCMHCICRLVLMVGSCGQELCATPGAPTGAESSAQWLQTDSSMAEHHCTARTAPPARTTCRCMSTGHWALEGMPVHWLMLIRHVHVQS